MLTLAQRTGIGKVDKPQAFARGQAARLPWAWNGLCFGVAMQEAGALGLYDIVNGIAPSVMSGVAWAVDSLGNPSANLGPSAYIQYPDTPFHDRPSLALTVHVRFKRVGTPEDWGGIIVNVHTALSAPYMTWGLFQHSTSAGQLGGQITNGSTDYLFGPTGSALPTTEYVNVFLRWRDGTFPEILAYGERSTLIVQTAGVSKSGALGYNTGQGIRLNASDDTTQNFAGHYSQAMVWNRYLTDTEMRWLCQDPFGWYAPRRETLIIANAFPLVSGGPVVQPAYGQSLVIG